ncbi:MAG: GH116 family glycosyl hydrolase [Verrucomicrobiota bacterium]
MKSSSTPDVGADLNAARREFFKKFGLGAAWLMSSRALRVVAGPFDPATADDHWVPMDKKLQPDWVKSLYARGQRTWYSGTDLKTIGMPVGGICAGQIYLTGEGRLVYWDILNRQHNTGYGAINYKVGRLPTEVASQKTFSPALPVEQGFALRVTADGQTRVRALDQAGFPAVRFCGEYPVGCVEYAAPDFPVETRLEVFSPFIPLNAADSALPAIIHNFTLKNTGQTPAQVTLGGWLENCVLALSAAQYGGRTMRVNTRVRGDRLAGFTGSVVAEASAPKPVVRPPQVFADFEGETYGDWTVEGEAFGKGPARGTLPTQQPVTGFQGKGLVNTFLDGDKKHGRLLSPEFKIERPWIGFLIGGGSHAGTCMNLLVDGKIVRTATGKDAERLDPGNWSVQDFLGKTARIEIVDRESGGWGHINVDQIEFRDAPMDAEILDLDKQRDYGTIGLVALGDSAAEVSLALPDGPLPDALFRSKLETIGEPKRPLNAALRGAVARTVTLRPGETAVISFVVAWHFPNLYYNRALVGNQYATKFKDAAAVAVYVAGEFERLCAQTRLWHATYYDSTLPWWLLDRVHSTVSTLATTTCQWWRGARFWAWEGCGCCNGTCGHVWNYAQAMGRLFPELERSVREQQDFFPGRGLNAATGAIGFRGDFKGRWAGDAQGGYILKAYREHQCAADDQFLQRVWPNVKQAVQFLIDQDGDGDGLIEGAQHQTYDQEYYGANTFVGALYLGALRAAEEMAREMQDPAFADTCRKIFEAGSKNSMQKLFNGEYFIQTVDLAKHPNWQYADGCLADQLFGQCWAHQTGLGYLYQPAAVRKALASVWTYCWAPDIGPQNKAHTPERWYAFAGEAGLFTCTWPKSKHLGAKSTRYRDEMWTGIEYQVASHMAWEGMLTEALAICRGVHDRYHPAKHNPWNEIECGDHYSRAMASWGMITALSGFEYHGPAGALGFAPRLTPENFRCAFTGAEGWGTLAQTRTGQRQINRIEVKWGQLRLQSLKLAWPAANREPAVKVLLAGKPVEARLTGGHTLQFTGDLRLTSGQTLEVICDS